MTDEARKLDGRMRNQVLRGTAEDYMVVREWADEVTSLLAANERQSELIWHLCEALEEAGIDSSAMRQGECLYKLGNEQLEARVAELEDDIAVAHAARRVQQGLYENKKAEFQRLVRYVRSWKEGVNTVEAWLALSPETQRRIEDAE